MPTINIIVLAIIAGGALAFMAEMIWFSLARNQRRHDDVGREAPDDGQAA